MSITPLSFALAVPMTPLSHGARSYTKIDFHWLSGVNDTAQFWLSGVNNTAEPWLSGVIGDLKLEYLGILTSFFETILGCESEASGEMFHEKKKAFKKSRETVPLSGSVSRNYIRSRSGSKLIVKIILCLFLELTSHKNQSYFCTNCLIFINPFC